MDKANLPKPMIRISHDEMEGYMTLPMRKADDAYTLSEVMEAINKGGVLWHRPGYGFADCE